MTSVDRIQGLSGSLAVKAPVRVATTAAITLAGEQTIDGVAVVTGDRVLVKDQGTTSENGIYDCATGAWTRALDFNGVNDVVNGTLILVAAGSVGTGLLFRVNGTNPIAPGTSAITFTTSASFASMSAYFATLMDDVDAATARATLGALGLGGDTMTGGLIFKAGLNNVASATPLVLTGLNANTLHVTGTTGFTAVTMTSGQVVDLVFDGILTLTHHATTNNLPGGANITTAAGDRARYWYDGATVRCLTYQKADGTAVVATTTSAASQAEVDAGTVSTKYIPPSLRKISLLATQATTSGTTKDFTIPAGARQITVMFNGVSTNGTSILLIQLGDANGVETTGYESAEQNVNAPAYSAGAGFNLNRASLAAAYYHGQMILTLMDPATFTWVMQGVMADFSGAQNEFFNLCGRKALTQELTTVRITTVNGTDAFDAGVIAVNYIL